MFLLVLGDEPGLTRTCLPHRTLGGCLALRSSQCRGACCGACCGAWLGFPAALKTEGAQAKFYHKDRRFLDSLPLAALPEGPKLRSENADGHRLI